MKKIKLFKIKSLQWQLISRIFFIIIILLLIMGVSQYRKMNQFLYKNTDNLLVSRFNSVDLSTIIKIQTSDEVVENADYLIGKMINHDTTVAIIDENGNFVASANKPKETEIIKGIEKSHIDKDHSDELLPIPKLSQNDYKKLLEQKGDLKGYKIIKDENNNLQVAIWRKIGNIDSPVGLIQLSTSAKPVQNILFEQTSIFLLSSGFILIIGGILIVLVFKYTLKSLNNVTSTITQVSIEELNTRLPVENGQIEIDRLALAFNNMLAQIETSFENEQEIKEKMRQFISDASHELRTPLTSIHGFSEVLLMGASKDEKKLELGLNSIMMESERLAKLVNDLLLLTNLDRKASIEMTLENINEIINEVYLQLKIISGQRNIILQLEDNMFANVNRDQIKQIIINLVQNAVHHTDEKLGTIIISTNKEIRFSNTYTVISVIDNGTGISEDHLDEIFDRFFRVEYHRSRKIGGYGLGLSIVKSIVDAHNGTIEVNSELGKGTTFFIYLHT